MNSYSLNWRELTRPQTLEADAKTRKDTYAKIECEPLERGFGTTLGNSLRRILLSSLAFHLGFERVSGTLIESESKFIETSSDISKAWGAVVDG